MAKEIAIFGKKTYKYHLSYKTFLQIAPTVLRLREAGAKFNHANKPLILFK